MSPTIRDSRAAAVRYKKAIDAYIAANPQHKAFQALVAFSGSMTGKEVTHASDEGLAGDVFAADDDDVFSESTMNPRQYGTDLRKVFDRPEFRVMIVANKFQTGFDQPGLCAMYLDKKIANAVEIVQTLSRLNRTAPGKDTTFVVDFVNEPQVILDAFARYDDGAKIQDVQNPNVVYDLQAELDKAGIYLREEVAYYTTGRFKSAAAYAAGEQAQHKELYAATSAPTQRFNDKVKGQRAGNFSQADDHPVGAPARPRGPRRRVRQRHHLRTQRRHLPALRPPRRVDHLRTQRGYLSALRPPWRRDDVRPQRANLARIQHPATGHLGHLGPPAEHLGPLD
jgi:hypothetical protein